MSESIEAETLRFWQRSADKYTRMMDCGCRRCREGGAEEAPGPLGIVSRPFIVCRICGNKRCPHATDHRNQCTGSNAPGQAGSDYA